MTDFDELERLARAATPGPWTRDADYTVRNGQTAVIADDWESYRGLVIAHEPDVDFIAAANPATILTLLSANREMRESTPDLTAVIAWLKNGCDPAHAVTELQIYQDRLARSALTTQRGGK